MFCHNCGNQLPDDAAFCGKCGTNQRAHTATAPANTTNLTNTIAIVGFILSFFVAIAGLICSIIGYNKTKQGAPHKGLAIAGIVISAVWMGFAFISIFRYL